MTLQTSGAISLADIQAEFGGSNPISITEYFRGGALVPDTVTNAGIPTSGPISLTDFYGAAAQGDVTPNNLSWLDVMTTGSNVFTITQTISGLGAGQSITISYTSTGDGDVQAQINNVISESNTFSVQNGDVIRFELITLALNFAQGVVTVRNQSDGNAILDAFNYSLGGGNDPFG